MAKSKISKWSLDLIVRLHLYWLIHCITQTKEYYFLKVIQQAYGQNRSLTIDKKTQWNKNTFLVDLLCDIWQHYSDVIWVLNNRRLDWFSNRLFWLSATKNATLLAILGKSTGKWWVSSQRASYVEKVSMSHDVLIRTLSLLDTVNY